MHDCMLDRRGKVQGERDKLYVVESLAKQVSKMHNACFPISYH